MNVELSHLEIDTLNYPLSQEVIKLMDERKELINAGKLQEAERLRESIDTKVELVHKLLVAQRTGR